MELEPMMSIRDVAQTLGVHRNTVMAMVKKNRLPEPVRFGPRMMRWQAAPIRELAEGFQNEQEGK